MARVYVCKRERDSGSERSEAGRVWPEQHGKKSSRPQHEGRKRTDQSNGPPTHAHAHTRTHTRASHTFQDHPSSTPAKLDHRTDRATDGKVAVNNVHPLKQVVLRGNFQLGLPMQA